MFVMCAAQRHSHRERLARRTQRVKHGVKHGVKLKPNR